MANDDVEVYRAKAERCEACADDPRVLPQHKATYREAARMWRQFEFQAAMERPVARALEAIDEEFDAGR